MAVPNTDFLPRKIQSAFTRFAGPESLKALLAMQGNPQFNSWFDDFHGDGPDRR